MRSSHMLIAFSELYAELWGDPPKMTPKFRPTRFEWIVNANALILFCFFTAYILHTHTYTFALHHQIPFSILVTEEALE